MITHVWRIEERQYRRLSMKQSTGTPSPPNAWASHLGEDPIQSVASLVTEPVGHDFNHGEHNWPWCHEEVVEGAAVPSNRHSDVGQRGDQRAWLVGVVDARVP